MAMERVKPTINHNDRNEQMAFVWEGMSPEVRKRLLASLDLRRDGSMKHITLATLAHTGDWWDLKPPVQALIGGHFNGTEFTEAQGKKRRRIRRKQPKRFSRAAQEFQKQRSRRHAS